MYKLLFDSDALIKLSKADLLETAAGSFAVLITEEIYNETVEEGKKGFHPDADKIESLVNAGEIKIIKKKDYGKNKLPKENFGRGEVSVFQAYKKGRLIVTDDLSFSLYIHKENIKSVSSAHLLLALLKKRKIQKNEAESYLEKLRPYIRDGLYKIVKKDIEGEQK